MKLLETFPFSDFPIKWCPHCAPALLPGAHAEGLGQLWLPGVCYRCFTSHAWGDENPSAFWGYQGSEHTQCAGHPALPLRVKHKYEQIPALARQSFQRGCLAGTGQQGRPGAVTSSCPPLRNCTAAPHRCGAAPWGRAGPLGRRRVGPGRARAEGGREKRGLGTAWGGFVTRGLQVKGRK